jgi:lysophospholipase L1-like esterase
MLRKLLFSSLFINLLLIIGGLLAIHYLGGFRYVLYKMKNRGLAAEYEHRKTLLMNLPLEKGDIVFLGNSITAQCEWAELLNNPKIKNRGISGDTSDGVLERLGLITQSEPSKVFLMIGINDLLFHSPDYILENYKEILNRLQSESPMTEVYVYSVLPVNNQVRNIMISNTDIETLNKGIKDLSKDNSLKYIDLHSKLLDAQGNLDSKYTSDGIHINGTAYMVWKEEILPFLE